MTLLGQEIVTRGEDRSGLRAKPVLPVDPVWDPVCLGRPFHGKRALTNANPYTPLISVDSKQYD